MEAHEQVNCPVCGFRLNRMAQYRSGNHEYPPRFVYRLYFCSVCQNEWINRTRRKESTTPEGPYNQSFATEVPVVVTRPLPRHQSTEIAP